MALIDRVLSYMGWVCDRVCMTSALARSEADFAVSIGSRAFLRLDSVTCGPCRELTLGNSNEKAVAP